MPGGKIPPDGRKPAPPGVGKTARRHDLEAPATPGLHDSDLQQGDVQKLEQAQKIAPRAKRTQPSAQGQAKTRRRQGANRGSGQFSMEVPDPIDAAAQRVGGEEFSGGDARSSVTDAKQWMPLMQFMASSPNSNAAIVKGLIDMYSDIRRKPIVSEMNVIDMNELDETLSS